MFTRLYFPPDLFHALSTPMTGDVVSLERISPDIILLRPPEKLVIEVKATGGYYILYWSKNDNFFGDTNFPVTFPDEFPNFMEIFVRDNTTVNDIGIYRVQPIIDPESTATPTILPGPLGVDFVVIAPGQSVCY